MAASVRVGATIALNLTALIRRVRFAAVKALIVHSYAVRTENTSKIYWNQALTPAGALVRQEGRNHERCGVCDSHQVSWSQL